MSLQGVVIFLLVEDLGSVLMKRSKAKCSLMRYASSEKPAIANQDGICSVAMVLGLYSASLEERIIWTHSCCTASHLVAFRCS